jgi:thioredoxin reductase (NADPH)
MGIEVVAGVGLLGLLGVALFTARSLLQARAVEAEARKDLKETRALGRLPPSLHPKIDFQTCVGSGSCVDACPEQDVIRVVDGKAAVVNPQVCIGHGECLRACPTDAIALVMGTDKRGVDIPLLKADFQTDVPGLYIVGELGGMGLIYNATTQALQAVKALVATKPPKVDGVHQLVIVGCGPAGLAASLAAKEAGLDFVTVDQESIGGTVLHYPRHKIVMTRPVVLPLYGKLQFTEVSKEALLDVWKEILAKTGLEVRTGVRVEGVKRGDDGVFTLTTSAGTLRTQRVLLAMGRRGSPRKLGVPGEELSKVVYRLQEPEAYAGRRVLVVGGGDAAVEAACSLAEAGATVHLAHRGKVFDRIKPKNQQRLDQSKLTILLEAQTKELRPDCAVIDVSGAPQELPNDDVIVLIGGVLPTAFLEAAGVKVKSFKGEVYAPANV